MVKGLRYNLAANSAHDAHAKVSAYLIRNGVEVDSLTIWFHLNLYWLPKVSLQNRLVSVDALKAVEKESDEVRIEKEGYNPKSWGSILWSKAGLMLAKKSYSESELRAELDTWAKYLADETIGCGLCLEHWKENYAEAVLKTQEQARLFILNTQNKIRKSQGRGPITRAEADKKYHWNP